MSPAYFFDILAASKDDYQRGGISIAENKSKPPNNAITHTNKDVIAKVLTENYRDKSLAVYGLTDMPKIKRMLSPSYPAVTATEFYGDNVFLLEGNWLLLLEYESQPLWEDFLKYNKYVLFAVERLLKEGIRVVKVVIAVLYTGDVQQTVNELDLGGLHIQLEQVYLSKFDTDSLFSELEAKVKAKERLSDEDIMRFIILPLTQPDKKRKQSLIENTVALAKQVEDNTQQAFILAGILTATNKFIDPSYAKSVKEWLKMTQVARLLIDEALEERHIEIAKTMLIRKSLLDDIMAVTGFSESKVREIQVELEQ